MKIPASSIEKIVSLFPSKARVFVHGGAATPQHLMKAICQNKESLSGIELIHLHTEGPSEWTSPESQQYFRTTNLFVGANARGQLNFEQVDYLPCFLSEIPNLFRSQIKRVDVALLQLSPPNEQGLCSLGTSVDVARAAFDAARIVIAQINHKMPFVYHDGLISLQDIDAAVEISEPLPDLGPKPFTEIDKKIGEHVASLVEDGSCLQVGIGAIPNAVLAALHSHKHLGVHSEMWSDGILNLIQSGAVDNTQKYFHPGKTVSSFLMGSQRLYDFIHQNPKILQLGADIINNPSVIAQNPKVVSINSAVEIDLTGQVCADSIGHRVISGVGGQLDFIRGASLSKGGKAIIALPSRTKKGKNRLVSALAQGAGVVSTRAHVHFIATEYGVVDLYGKSLGERARALIQITHPEDRERLEREWHQVRTSLR